VTTFVIWSRKRSPYWERTRRWSGAPAASSASSWRRFEKARKRARNAAAEHQPARDLDLDRRRAAEHADHEAGRDRHAVEDDDMFERKGVSEIQHDVARQRHGEPGPEGERAGHGAGGERRRGGRGDARRQLASGDRALRLERVAAVGLAVAEVVDEVDGARRGAEEGEGGERAAEQRRVVGAMREDERRQHEEVLDPLGGPQ
jgi:hypothetical protein